MKGKKIALGILATACTIGGAVALFGCNKDGHAHDYETEFTAIVNSDGTSEYHAHKCKIEGCNVTSGSEKHDWAVAETAATCTTAKTVVSTCKVCNYSKTETEGEALGHVWGNVTIVEEPTDTKQGKVTLSCTRSGCTVEDEEYKLPTLGSTDYTLTNDTATCAAAGTATYTYNKDGVNVSFSAASPVNANNHVYDTTKWATNGAQHWHAASCGHKVIENAANVADVADHETGADGYCTVCYTTALTAVRNEFKFVAGNGIKFTAFVYGMSGNEYTFTYNGATDIKVEYGGYSDQGVFSSQTATLANGDSFNFTLTGNQDVIYITSDSTEQITGIMERPAQLGENDLGYPVAASKAGEKYTFIGKTTEAGDKFQYVLTCDNDNAEIYIDGESGKEKITLPYKFKLANNAEKVFYMSYAGDTEISTYNVVITSEWEEGSVINPKTATLGEATSVTVPAGDEYYCAFLPNENGWYKVSSTTQNAMLIAGSGNSDEKYGTKGSGFVYYAYIADASIYEGATVDSYYAFRIASLDGGELNCNFTVEKVADATELALGEAKSGNNVYSYTAAANGPYYNITVSELPASGYWAVVYDSTRGKKTIETTLTTLSFNPTESTVFTVIYGSSTGTVTLEEDANVTRLALGKNSGCSGNTEYIFTAPEAGTYTVDCLKPTNVTKWYYKKKDAASFTTATAQTATIELAAGEQLIVKHSSTAASGKDITILPAGTTSLLLSRESSVAALNKDTTQLVYFAGTTDKIYRLVTSNENIVFADENGVTVSSNEFTVDENGSLFVRLKYVGDGEASEAFTVKVEQKIALGENSLSTDTTYYYKVSEAGNYAIDLTLIAEYGEFITLNGVETEITEDATTYVLGYFSEGSIFTLKIESYTDLKFTLKIVD